MQSLNQKEVAVSKPCCPACWDFMSVLQANDASGAFNVCSRHSTVYPVELPAWLPKDVCAAMVKKFQLHLFEQLQIMDRNSRNHGPIPDYRKHHHTYSIDSDSGPSIASGVTHASDLQAGDGTSNIYNTVTIARRRGTVVSAPEVTPAAV